MRSGTQLFLNGFNSLGAKEFGGALLRGNPRMSRPVSTKRPLHLVMKSSLATGSRSFLHASRARRIRALVFRLAREKDVKVYRFANGGNHLHFVILPKSRKAYQEYIRALSGLIARITLCAQRGKSAGQKFWDARPFTRILEWGRDYKIACGYLLRNALEAKGFIPYQPRKPRSGKRESPE